MKRSSKIFACIIFVLSALFQCGGIEAQGINRYDRQGKKHGLWKDSTGTLQDKKIVDKGVYEHGKKTGKWTETFAASNYGRIMQGTYTNGLRNGWWVTFSIANKDTLLYEKRLYRKDTVIEYLMYDAPYYNFRDAKGAFRRGSAIYLHHYVCSTGDTVIAEEYYHSLPSDSGKLNHKTSWTDFGKPAPLFYPSRPPGALRTMIEEYYNSGQLCTFVDSIYLQNRVVKNEYAENGKLKRSETVTGPFGFRNGEWWGDRESPGYYFFENGKRIQRELPDSLHPVVREGIEYPEYDSTLSCCWTEVQVGYSYTRTRVCMSGTRIRSSEEWSYNVMTHAGFSRWANYFPSGRLQRSGSSGSDTTFYENGKIARIDISHHDGSSQFDYYPDGKLKQVRISRESEWRLERYNTEGKREE